MKLSIIVPSWRAQKSLRSYLQSNKSFSSLDSFDTLGSDKASNGLSSEPVEQEFLHVPLDRSAVNSG
jgi:hypothetical protein